MLQRERKNFRGCFGDKNEHCFVGLFRGERHGADGDMVRGFNDDGARRTFPPKFILKRLVDM